MPKDVRQNFTQLFIIKIPNRQELHETDINHSSDTDFDGFKRLSKICTAELYLFLVIDTSLPSGDLLHF